MFNTLTIALLNAVVILLAAVIWLFVRNRKLADKCARYKQGIAVQKIFLQNMSHDIRTPMNSICGFSQILCNSQVRSLLTEEEIAEYGAVIQNNTEMLCTLVDDILDISDMESGKYRLNFSDAKVNDLCHKTLSTAMFRCPTKVKMYMTTDLSDDFTLHTDPKRVEQVLMNYLTNAVKHTKEGEIHLHVSDKEIPGYVAFSVTDTGEGVPMDKVETIFRRFEKLGTLNSGTGLGLSICRKIATQLGGQARLDSSYKEGARFLFIHPLHVKERQDKEQ